MNRPGRLKKVMLWGLGIVALLLVGLWIAARLYLSSESTNRQVAERLEQLLGGKVRIASSSIGLVGDSSLENVEVYEKDAPEGGKPWLRLAQVEADVSALDLVGKDALPGNVTASGAELYLRFDRAGQLMTKLPEFSGNQAGPLPRITLAESKLTLDQTGQPPLVLDKVKATFHEADGALAIEGTVEDPSWGKWEVGGSLAVPGGKIHLTLTTGQARVTQEKLESIPFVPKKVWENVKAEGTTPVKLTLDYRPPAGDKKANVHYRVEMSPSDTTVTIPSIDLTAHDARGNVVVEDELVELRDVVGQTAEGAIRVPKADLNFRSEPSVLQFHPIAVEKVQLSKLPASWKLPTQQVNGQLTGEARLDVFIPDQGPVRTQGTGEGKIFPGTVAGLRVEEPILLRLHAEGQEFKFNMDMKSAARALAPKLMPVLDFLASAGAPSSSEEVSKTPPGQPADCTVHVAKGKWQKDAGEEKAPPVAGRPLPGPSRFALSDLQFEGFKASSAPPESKEKPGPKPDAKAKPKAPNYLEIQFSLKDIELAELFRRLDIKPPFPLKGKVSLKVQAAIPYETPRDVKAYRVRGDVDLAKVEFGGLELDAVKARIVFEKGVLELTELSARFPQEEGGGAPGTFAGTARLEVEPRGDLSADVKLDRIPAGRLASFLPIESGLVRGTFSGSLKAKVPSEKVTDPTAWDGNVSLRAESLRLFGLTVADLAADLAVGKGQARFTTLRVRVGGTPITASGDMKLAEPYPFAFKLDLGKGTGLGALNDLAPGYKLPFPVEGAVNLSASATGTLRPLKYSARGTIRADKLGLAGVKAEALSVDWELGEKGLALSNLRVRLNGGDVTGSAQLPLDGGDKGSADLKLKGVEVDGLFKLVPDLKLDARGKVTGSVQAEVALAGAREKRRLKGKFDITSPRLVVKGIPFEKLAGSVEYQAGKGNYQLKGKAFGLPFTASGKFPAEPKKETPGEPKKETPDKPGEELACQPDPPEEFSGEGRFQIRQAPLGPVWETVGLQRQLRPLAGVVSVDVSYRHVGTTFSGQGRLEVNDLRWEGKELARRFGGDILIQDEAVELRNVSVGIGQGVLRGRAVYNLANPARSFFRVTLLRVPADLLLAPVPDVADLVSGSVSGSIAGRLGSEWRGEGTLTLDRGRVFRVAVSDWRMRIDFGYAPSTRVLEVHLRESQAQVGRGRARARAQ
jgi:hypothetical protein